MSPYKITDICILWEIFRRDYYTIHKDASQERRDNWLIWIIVRWQLFLGMMQISRLHLADSAKQNWKKKCKYIVDTIVFIQREAFLVIDLFKASVLSLKMALALFLPYRPVLPSKGKQPEQRHLLVSFLKKVPIIWKCTEWLQPIKCAARRRIPASLAPAYFIKTETLGTKLKVIFQLGWWCTRLNPVFAPLKVHSYVKITHF